MTENVDRPLDDPTCWGIERMSSTTATAVARMSHSGTGNGEKSKQEPRRARSGRQISCSLVSLHFLCDILATFPVGPFRGQNGLISDLTRSKKFSPQVFRAVPFSFSLMTVVVAAAAPFSDQGPTQKPTIKGLGGGNSACSDTPTCTRRSPFKPQPKK